MKIKKDKWGLPLLKISMEYGENEKKMRVDMQQTAVEMLKAAELDWVQPFDRHPTPGTVIHEMGTARMGNDPKTSVLNKWNQSARYCQFVCNRWLLHGFISLSKSIAYLYGTHCPCL